MKLKVDKHSRVPTYVQIAERVKHMVATGHLRPGDQLPTVRQLAQDLQVNFNTVARAYTLLHNAGVISAQQGRGTYVRERPDEHALLHLRTEKLGALAGLAIIDAFSLGYTSSEVRSAFRDAIRQMEKESKR
jgi:GntR family transcriptional regulator